MKRYLVEYNRDFIVNSDYDVIIVGAGIAGLYTALNISKNLKVCVLIKKDIFVSDSYLAQGGIAASIGDDDRQLHIEDTLNAGCYINDKEAVNTLVYESEEGIDSLVKLGVNFDKDSKGNFYRSLEGNHSIPRILHVNGDATGKGIMDVLIKRASEAPNIELITNVFVIDVVTDDKKVCTGVTGYYKGKFFYFKSKCCVIASGGIGQIFSKTTNMGVLTGDGIAMAIRAGAELENMQYVQFHPTALYSDNNEERMFLISEAVRGEGAVLRRKNRERFMMDYDSRMELAPRDIVARAIKSEMERYNLKYVYLDVTMHDEEFLKNRFKTIYSKCNKLGIAIDKNYIPVTPAQHYFMGGIKVDLYGRTSLKNLYAVGECSCTGVHGANRLASNSLMEAVVFGRRVAVDISNICQNYKYDGLDSFCSKNDNKVRNLKYKAKSQNFKLSMLKKNIKNIMEKDVGIIRTVNKLEVALEALEKLMNNMESIESINEDYIEIYNMCQVSTSVILAAINSKSSIGSNYVKEYCKAFV